MNIKKLLGAGIVAGAVAFSSIGAAGAAVNVDSQGYGFVGKGDVQLAFTWNNKELQANAKDVTFSYESVDAYVATCSWTTGEGTKGEKDHDVDHKKKTKINAAIAYDARLRNQITGFNLNGFDLESTTTSGSVPVVGGTCPGSAGHAGTWTSVTEPVSTGGGLFVNYGPTSVALPNTPVV